MSLLFWRVEIAVWRWNWEYLAIGLRAQSRRSSIATLEAEGDLTIAAAAFFFHRERVTAT